MTDHSKVVPRPLFHRDMNSDPFHGWARPSRIFEQDLGLPPFLEPGDLGWINWARRRLAMSSWPGYTRTPLFASSGLPGPQHQHEVSGGVSELRTGPDCWKIVLNVKHFSPEEITVKTKEGYLEIAGKHEERQDEHGFVSRCFTRKYKLPSGADLLNISSSLSGDGVLTVEAPLMPLGPTLTPEIVIPIQVEEEGNNGGKDLREMKQGNLEETAPPAGGEEHWAREEKPKSGVTPHAINL
ncbi:heat shock protein beta-1-like [Brienomyrus brachyistius]|uniref:heat shock protein beta-1-like n=1 Tax=Brienomyrus brachyistius TaxID=42636 RepID=UPI0020B19CD2|nr:heat shock protein beta-1-like [Brienomyrus brachyistius]XP_048860621.1 heat shock protein beta-1-like [Brienomyrus brachyistius]